MLGLVFPFAGLFLAGDFVGLASKEKCIVDGKLCGKYFCFKAMPVPSIEINSLV